MSHVQKVSVYTDGSCHNNPGTGGWACVLLATFTEINGQKTDGRMLGIRRISGYGGTNTTNNIMELTAVSEALKALKKKDRDTVIFTDSKYVVGVLSQGWTAKKNKTLIASIRRQISEFSRLTFQHTKGHSGDTWNEECDRLANEAIKNKQGVDEYDIQPAPEQEKKDDA